MKTACESIEKDESFSIEAEGAKTCLKLARQMRTYAELNGPEMSEFAEWLIEQFKTILHEATAVASLDQCILWSRFHQLRCSDQFNQKWKSFLLSSKLEHSNIFCQSVTSRIFDHILKDSFPIYSELPFDSDNNNVQQQAQLTYEEENAIRYVGGYIIRNLKKKKRKDDNIGIALNDLVDNECSEEPEESEEWIGSIDRGGLIYINNNTFQLLCSIEYCLRGEMNIGNVHNLDDNFKQRMKSAIDSDEDVQFNWTLVSVEMDDEVADKILDLIVDMWITIRGFSFASSVMEMYKIEKKQGTQKSRRLRHNVTQN